MAPSWTLTASDVIVGGTAGVRAAKTGIIRDIWLKGMGKHPSGADARIALGLGDIKGIGLFV